MVPTDPKPGLDVGRERVRIDFVLEGKSSSSQ